jgi:predicted Fe-Mo cluster-binding NifX family protein
MNLSAEKFLLFGNNWKCKLKFQSIKKGENMLNMEKSEIPKSEETKTRKAGKIAVTSTGGSMDALVSEQFGRCHYFLIVDPKTMKFEAVSNLGEEMQSGAGPKAAELIIGKGAGVLLTGHVGDKAEEALKRGGVKIVDGFNGAVKIKDAVNSYLANKNPEK